MSQKYFEAIGMWSKSERHLERTYVTGFLISLALTLGAYWIAVEHIIGASEIVPVLLVFAALQFIAQIFNFLHVSGEQSSRERLIILFCACLIMLILVVGSMWIMNNLDQRMMPSASDMELYMAGEQGM